VECGGHVRVRYSEVLVIEGVEDAFVVLEDLVSLGDASVFVYDEAVTTVCPLGGCREFLETW
jgi:hypothetical protein